MSTILFPGEACHIGGFLGRHLSHAEAFSLETHCSLNTHLFPGEACRIGRFLGRHLSDDEAFSLEAHCSFDAMRRNSKLNYKAAPFMDQSKTKFMRKGTVNRIIMLLA